MEISLILFHFHDVFSQVTLSKLLRLTSCCLSLVEKRRKNTARTTDFAEYERSLNSDLIEMMPGTAGVQKRSHHDVFGDI